MATKKAKAKTLAKPPAMTDQEKTEHRAEVTLRPSANAAAVVAEYAKAFGEQDVQALIEQLRPHMNEVNDGNCSTVRQCW